jgi:membrane-associated phospholipid phosphatase
MKYADEYLELSGNHTRFARVISRLTAAPLYNLYMGIIFIFFSPIGLGPILTPWPAMFICIIFMVALPIAPIIYEAWRGKVDLDVSEQSMRAPFFLFAIFIYVIAFDLYLLASCDIMMWLSAAYVTVTTGVMIATRWSKVSVHAAGVGGPSTALFFIYGILAWPVILIWILVIWSRIYLHQHTFTQAVVGLILAILITFGTYLLMVF